MRAAIFDCDGTLVDSEPLARRAWERSLEPYGYEVTHEDLAACLGRDYPHAHSYFAARAALPDPGAFWPALARELFGLLDQELRPFTDAVGVARRLSAEGLPLAVASSSPRERLQRTLERAGVAGLFGVTVAGDEVAHGKPAPDMILAAARRLGVAPDRCVVVEDSPPGVAAARAAGMAVVAVARGSGDAPGLAGAHVVVRELTHAALLEASGIR